MISIEFSGDVVVATNGDKKWYDEPMNVTYNLFYPLNGGDGAFLTYIMINVNQTSPIGQAYVTSGGINQHNINIVLEANVTTFLNFDAFMYGIN